MKFQGKWWLLAVLFVTGLSLTRLEAAQVEGLYEDEIPVVAQGRKERSEVLERAMQTVLVRISGRGDVASLAGIGSETRLARRYIEQFRYRTLDKPVTEPVSGKETSQVLWVRFNEKAINQLLHRNNLPIWGRNRPSVLVWLVVDDRRQRHLISNDSQHVVRSILEQQAQQRGLPLRFPLLDLTDRSNLSISDVWANFEDTIIAASKRYQAEAILVGRVYQDYSGGWNGRWSLYNQGRREDWSSRNDVLAGTIAPGIEKTTNSLARQYAKVQQQGENSQLLVEVSAVKGLVEYNKVHDYLLSLTTVTSIQPYQVERDKVIFQVVSRSGRVGLEQSISLGNVLVENIPETPVITPTTTNEPVTSNPENTTGQPATTDNPGTPETAQAAVITLRYRLLQ